MLVGLATATLLCIGDSITWGGHAGVTQPFCDQLGGQNEGRPGGTTTAWLNNFFAWGVPHLEPGQNVHLLLGVNDTGLFGDPLPALQYGDNMRALIDLLDDAGRTVFLTPQYQVLSPGTDELLLAYAEQVAVIWAQGLAQPGAPLFTDPPVTLDGVHPSQAGHDHIADLLRPILIPEAASGTLLGLGLVALASGARARRGRLGVPRRREDVSPSGSSSSERT
jgi:lysophospholipase L1-like esterase